MDTNSFVEIYYLEPYMKTDSDWVNIRVNLNYEGGKHNSETLIYWEVLW